MGTSTETVEVTLSPSAIRSHEKSRLLRTLLHPASPGAAYLPSLVALPLVQRHRPDLARSLLEHPLRTAVATPIQARGRGVARAGVVRGSICLSVSDDREYIHVLW